MRRVPTILIPAHDEAEVIARTLGHMRIGMQPGEFRIVVVANGCSDDTAARARAAAPDALVFETSRAGKANALNIGRLAASPGAPLVVLDADLEVTAEALRALVAPLLAGRATATCGRMEVLTENVSPLVRMFYRGWRLNPYFGQGKFGGLFGLSPEGAERVFPLPAITADDEYIRRSFAPEEVVFVRGCAFTAKAPATLASLFKVRRRSLRGARAVTRMGKPRPEAGSLLRMARRALARPSEIVPFAVFGLVMALVRVFLLFEPTGAAQRWERDLTSRRAG
jgi:glycosyltransferase involved in cell wall biosynthesis